MEDYIGKRIEYLENKINQLESQDNPSIDDICELKAEIRLLTIEYYSASDNEAIADIKRDIQQIKMDYYSRYKNQQKNERHNTFKLEIDNTKPIKNDTLSNIKEVKNKKISDISFGKKALSITAGLMLIIAVLSGLATMWDSIPNIVKYTFIILVGQTLAIYGYLKYNKTKIYPYIVLMSAGSVITYIGVIAFQQIFHLLIVLAFVLIWEGLNHYLYFKTDKTSAIVIAALGLALTTMFMTGMISDTNGMLGIALITILISIIPVIVAIIAKIKDNYYHVISGLSAISNIVILMQSIINIFNDNYRFTDGLYTYSVLKIIAILIACSTICAGLLLYIGGKMDKSKNVIRIIITTLFLVYILIVQFNILNSDYTQKCSIINYLVYMLPCIILTLGTNKNQRNYCITAFHLLVSIIFAILVYESTGIDTAIALISTIIFVGVSVFLYKVHSRNYKIERILLALSTSIMVFTTLYSTLEQYSQNNRLIITLDFIGLTVAYGLLTYINIKLWKNKDKSVVIIQAIVDLGIISGLSIIASIGAIQLFSVLLCLYTLGIKILGEKIFTDSIFYRNWCIGLLLFLIISMCDMPDMYYTWIILLCINVYYLVHKNIQLIPRVGLMISQNALVYMLCTLDNQEGVYNGALINIIILAVLTIVGLKISSKSLRIGSISIMIISLFILTSSIFISSFTVSNVIKTLIGGIIVFSISIAYSRIQKEMETKSNIE